MTSQDSINALLALHLAKTLGAGEHTHDLFRGRSRSFASQDEIGLSGGGASKYQGASK